MGIFQCHCVSVACLKGIWSVSVVKQSQSAAIASSFLLAMTVLVTGVFFITPNYLLLTVITVLSTQRKNHG